MGRARVVTTRVPFVEQMDDETFIRHLEARHGQDLAMEFKPLPGKEGEPRRLLTRIAHEAYHHILHNREGVEHDHHHDYPLFTKTNRPHSPREGTIIRDKTSKELFRWDGRAWKTFSLPTPDLP